MTQPTLFVNHGGGPCFFFEPGPMRDAWRDLETYLRNVATTLPERPRAIVVVSGHWEAAMPTVNANVRPALLFDYSGFPEETYRLTYPAPGVLDVGSGQSYHDVRGFFAKGIDARAEAFDAWLHATMRDARGRDAALQNWSRAPGARAAQPYEDHLLPLMVAAGAAAGEAGTLDFHARILDKPVSGFRFG